MQRLAVHQSADPRMLGRVMALFALVLPGGTWAGGPIAASVAAIIGARAPFLAGAGGPSRSSPAPATPPRQPWSKP